ncbi:hypothetical protein [Actinokineospora iranica]|uniref:hypothetical protein n=1 Tax=Actinokineospora iranica TaxID=1271860 RepID=UPI001113C0F7|nr:hypothetical protein [Actinokineospora iranica]
MAVQYPEVEVPKDRDEGTVVKALRALNPCVLFDPTAIGFPAGTTPEPPEAHKCAISKGAGDSRFIVDVDDRFDRIQKYNAASLVLNGATAYLTSGPGVGQCQVAIPATFEVAVTIVGRDGPRSQGDLCASVKAAGEVAVGKLGALVFRSEPDVALIGACVDFPFGMTCQPSTAVPVPIGPEAAFAAAAGDARVACEITRDAFGVFSSGFAPVLGSRVGEPLRCYLVESSHTVVIEVAVYYDSDLTDGTHTAGGLGTTVAGRPATIASTKEQRRLCLLPVPGSKIGLMCVVAYFLPGRGVAAAYEVDSSKAPELDRAVADVVAKRFS